MGRDVATRRTGQERDGIGVAARIFDQDRTAKRITAGRQQRVRNLLDASVQRPHHGYVGKQRFPPLYELLADEVMREQAHHEDEGQREQRADARQVEAQQRLRTPRLRQQRQRLIHRADNQPQHPQRDGQRHQHEQSGEEVGFQRDLLGHGLGFAVKAGQVQALLPPVALLLLLLAELAVGALDTAGVEAAGVAAEPAVDVLPAALPFVPSFAAPAAGAASALPALAPSAGLAAGLPPLLPSRKSVTYQPEPLSWKPAAVTCLLKVSWPHSGHSVNGASESFCKASFSKPHDEQR